MSPPLRPSPVLSASALSAERGERTLFSNVGFELETGEVLHVTGANGSGKTTFLRLLCGLREPHRGEILWRGKPLSEQGACYRSELAFLGHQDGVKFELSPLENVRALAALRGGTVAMSPERALVRTGIKENMDLPCRVLSAGQRRRVALAALLVTPKILWVLDEPFNTLDKNGTELVADFIVRHRGRGGMTVLTSHQALPGALTEVHSLALGG